MLRKPNSIRSRVRRLLTTALAMTAVAGAQTAAAQDASYQTTPADLVGPPGSVIREEVTNDDRKGATDYRVLYRSVGLHGEPIAVSGTIIVPVGPAPPGGRPIVAWAHPTSGVEPQCGPSLARFRFEQIMGLRDMVRRGYIVTATDYPGLGAGGPHPYLVGDSEGRAVLDSVRAAESVAHEQAPGVALWGHSQGGQAVLYAAKLAPTYAPELRLDGVAAAAPATELGALMRDDLATPGGSAPIVFWASSERHGSSAVRSETLRKRCCSCLATAARGRMSIGDSRQRLASRSTSGSAAGSTTWSSGAP